MHLRHKARLAVAAVAVAAVGGVAALAAASPKTTAAADPAAAPGGAVATATVVRRTIQSVDVLDGTLGYTGSYSVTNLLATATAEAGGTGASQSAAQAYAAAKAQYDTAVANRDALRKPSAADITRAEATVAQARATLATARQADDGPTAAQLASARAALTAAKEALASARAQRDAAEAAVAACADALATTPTPAPLPSASPDPGASLDPAASTAPAPSPTAAAPSCDPDALALALDRALGDVKVRTAQRDAAQAALDTVGDAPANAATAIKSALAGVEAAEAALDALRNPTKAKLRQADDAVAVARTQLDEAKGTLGLPTGMITMVADVGAVVAPGGVLYAVDGTHPVILLAGETPAWRRLAPQMSDGPDVRQLEENLAALGFGFATVAPDPHWDDDTTDAVTSFQTSLGLDPDGTLELGQAVFLPGSIRVTEVLAERGAMVRDLTRVLAATSTEREVTIDLEADRQAIVTVGATVTVDLPDGNETLGSITEIGTVATTAAGAGTAADAVPTVAVTVTLADPGATGSLDGAPVKVSIVRERRDDVLAVPVGALLALAEGGYAVEVVDGPARTRLVGVEIGLFEDGFVEVRSGELTEGAAVVVPA